jgi:hypothetical protein
MTFSARSVLLLAFATTCGACDDSRAAAAGLVRERAVTASPAAAPAVATPATATNAEPVAIAASAASTPRVQLQTLPRARQQSVPLGIELRPPARFERGADGTRRIRIGVHVANRLGTPVICERTLFHARDGETRLEPEFDANAIAEENPLGPDQSIDGVLTFVIPASLQTPRTITVSYGLADEQAADALRVE